MKGFIKNHPTGMCHPGDLGRSRRMPSLIRSTGSLRTLVPPCSLHREEVVAVVAEVLEEVVLPVAAAEVGSSKELVMHPA